MLPSCAAQVNALRKRWSKGRRWLLLLEPCVLALLWSSMALLLPLASPCVKYTTPAELRQAAPMWATSNEKAAHVEVFWCKPAAGSSIAPAPDEQGTRYYNVLASLTLAGTEETLKKVGSRACASLARRRCCMVLLHEAADARLPAYLRC